MDVLELARKRFDRCVEAEAENRARALEDLEFKHGQQWPEAVERERTRDGKPCLTINLVPAYTRQVANDIRQIRPSIKFRPVDNGADREGAEVLNGLTRAVEQACGAEAAYDSASESAIDIGWGYFRITTDYTDDDSFRQDLLIKRIRNPFTVYLDPERESSDGSDAEYGFIETIMPRDEFESQWPQADSEWENENAVGAHKEKWFLEDRVRVAEYYAKEPYTVTLSLLPDGQVVEGDVDFAIRRRKITRSRVVHRVITAKEVLHETVWFGRHVPIVEVRGVEEVIDGETFLKGMVRDLRDAQRQYNYTQSAIVERLGVQTKSPWIGPKGSFTDPKWKRANRANYAYLEYEVPVAGLKPERVVPNDVSPGLMQQLVTSAEQMKQITSIYNAGLGDRSNEVSGVAIDGRKKESDVSNFHFVDNLARAMKHAGRIIADVAPKVYAGRIMNILQPDGTERTVGIGAQYYDREKGKDQSFDLSVGKYDVSVDIGPSYTTQRQESAESMFQFLQAIPQAANVTADLVANTMDWPQAEEFAKRLRSLLPPEILAGESPQVASVLRQAQQQTQAMQGFIAQLQQALAEKDLALKDKNGQLEVKHRELALKHQELLRKVQEMGNDYAVDMTRLELEHAANVPGSVV